MVFSQFSAIVTKLFLKFYELLVPFVKNLNACLDLECNHLYWSLNV